MKNKLFFICLFCLSFLFQNAQTQQNSIIWNPKDLQLMLGLADTKDITVMFVSKVAMSNVELWVVPELQPFVKVEPNHFDTIVAGKNNSVIMHFSIPLTANTRLYDGTIHIRIKSETYPQTLKINLYVAQVAKIIGTEGGNIIASDGISGIVIPSGALSEKTSIGLNILHENEIVPPPLGSLFRGGIELVPDGIQFTNPVTITFQLNMRYPEGTQIPVLYRQASAQGYSWETEGFATSPGDVIEAEINHSSSHIAVDKTANENEQQILKNEIIERISDFFNQYSGRCSYDKTFFKLGDLGKISNRLFEGFGIWKVNIYIEPDYLNKSGAEAAYVDQCIGYDLNYNTLCPRFLVNDIVLASRPSNVNAQTLYHEVLHAIFDKYDKELKEKGVPDDEAITWYMETAVADINQCIITVEAELAKANRSEPFDNYIVYRNLNLFVQELNKFKENPMSGSLPPITAEALDFVKEISGFHVNPEEIRERYLNNECGSIFRIAVVTPESRPVGMSFLLNWSGFTPSSIITSNIKKPNIAELDTFKVNTDSQGAASYNLDSTGYSPGIYEHWAIDDATGKVSNPVTFAVTIPILPPSIPDNPSPSNEGTGISVDSDLDWTDSTGATSYDVYFGTISPPPKIGTQTNSNYDPGLLDRNTKYYWKVVAKNSYFETSGPIWTFITLNGTSQNYWAKTYGYSSFSPKSIRQTNEGGYILAADINFNECWISKLSQNGDIEWQYAYTGPRYVYFIQPTRDGGYFVAGSIYSPTSPTTPDGWIAKFFPNGEIEWQKTFGGSYRYYAYSCEQTVDGGYVVAGNSYQSNVTDSNIWVLKLSPNGNYEWMRTYDRPGDIDSIRAFHQTSDGGYVIACNIHPSGIDDIWIIKLDSIGNIVWQRIYQGSFYYLDSCYSIEQTKDGGYIVAGDIYSNETATDIWILKLSPLGIIEWQRTYGGVKNDGARDIHQTSDGGYVVTGFTNLNGNDDIIVLKLSPEGNIEWQRAYGGNGDEYCWSIEPLIDGGYIIAAASTSFGGVPITTLVLKISSSGEMDVSCLEFIKNPNLTVSNTNIIPQTTFIVPQETYAVLSDTFISPRTTNIIVTTVCSSPTIILF